MLSLLTATLIVTTLQQEPVQTTGIEPVIEAAIPADICDETLCREARDVLFMVDGEVRASPIPINKSPYLLDNDAIILAPTEHVRLQLMDPTDDPGQILSFELLEAGLIHEGLDHTRGEMGELLAAFTLDNATESARLELTNYTGHNLVYALSLISVAGHPYNVETCIIADRDRYVMETVGQVFSFLINDIRIADENSQCRYQGTHAYPLLGE
jgi:hypothetical protein